MKRTVFIGLLLLLALASCHGPWETRSKASLDTVVSPEPQSPQRSQLMAIDSLLWQQPNTALAVLMEYLYEGGDTARPVITEETFNRHYANLLLSEVPLCKGGRGDSKHAPAKSTKRPSSPPAPIILMVWATTKTTVPCPPAANT